jgi:hypothetical protein
MQALAASCEELRARTGKPPLNIIKCSQPRFQAFPSYGEKTLVGAGHVTHRKWIAVWSVPLVQSGFEFSNPIIDFQFHLTRS